MKRFIITAVFVMCIAGGRVWAADNSGISVGVKTWINDWTHDVPGYGSVRSDYAVLIGPAVEARFGEAFYAEASYLLPASEYQFSEPVRSNIDRRDAEFMIGYYVVPGFGVEGGYKDATFKEKASGITDNVYGPLVGVTGYAYLDPNISFYGRLDYLFTTYRQEDSLGEFREDSPGWLIDVGFKAAFSPQVSGSLGYRYETNKGNHSDIRDSFSGAVIGVLVGF